MGLGRGPEVMGMVGFLWACFTEKRVSNLIAKELHLPSTHSGKPTMCTLLLWSLFSMPSALVLVAVAK